MEVLDPFKAEREFSRNKIIREFDIPNIIVGATMTYDQALQFLNKISAIHEIKPGGIYTIVLNNSFSLSLREGDEVIRILNIAGEMLSPSARFFILNNLEDAIITDQNTETLEYIISGLQEIIRLRAGNDT